ncbi:MAG: bifunctional 2-C-methyl-D-erythritol 4-phosphate cytidylyltransferase/2-C-methyl-D-erythritol 2,4-cyclodiphosphate synthase [Proteobacteria bacterium]|nr:bifunctional 2-C-methyl-D-erythritol 4-phosphate cytidylyltransferase/2-C-methyl-D-erythritol 2,4-cyclodiphosphate synthase [Pseudomonadota bacterium]
MTNIALIVAAGKGTRSGLDLPKQYALLGGRAVLRYSVETFLSHPEIDGVLVVLNPDHLALYEGAIEGLQLLPWVAGGADRQTSVRNGLESLQDLAPDQVLIHDAARPFVTTELIDHCLEGLKMADAVLPALAMVDTVKEAEDNKIIGTLDRERLFTAQTPQCFKYGPILAAHHSFAEEAVTDDIALAERAGIEVQLVTGEPDNFKITTADDMRKAERLITPSLTDIRTGSGFDVHAFEAGRELSLGGVKIAHDKGLKGHSDADVALHAITDALLGAIGAGDIGTHFPPSDEKWKGAASPLFLQHAAGLIRDKGGQISNIDLTIICEAPKIGPHREEMREKVAGILEISPDRVSIKGTTTEKLGFTGRGEGIAAEAIATVRLPE